MSSLLPKYFLRVLDVVGYVGGVKLLTEDFHAVEKFVPLQHANAEPEHAVGKVLHCR